ncbi:MAG: hypothetical protein ACI37T_08420 [Candidatus Gastranaerophilaceae bacterium]
MGLAASQARFLGLTARKSNTEYEGQQVNQQRTALANESASLYSQLTNLTVPTPPDIMNYYRTEYSFETNGDTYTMDSLPIRQSNGLYSVSLSHQSKIDAYKSLAGGDGLDMTGATSQKLSELPKLVEHMKAEAANASTSNKYSSINLDDGNQEVKFFSQNGVSYYNIGNNFYQYAPQVQTISENYTDVKLEYNESGDFKSIQHEKLTKGNEIAVSTNQVADDSAYDLAMNAYNKSYNEYEKTMAQINAKTEVLQQQDKTLELRLNQLDTEQNAISTEMDAVQKVIEKNVESTFKTFG